MRGIPDLINGIQVRRDNTCHHVFNFVAAVIAVSGTVPATCPMFSIPSECYRLIAIFHPPRLQLFSDYGCSARTAATDRRVRVQQAPARRCCAPASTNNCLGLEQKFPVVRIRDRQSYARPHGVRTLIENGFVHIPETAPWLDAYLHELTVFPKGKHDDQVDSTAQFLDWFKRPSSFQWWKEFMRLQFEAQAAKQPRKPQPAQPDPARGSMEWFAAQEKLKNSS